MHGIYLGYMCAWCLAGSSGHHYYLTLAQTIRKVPEKPVRDFGTMTDHVPPYATAPPPSSFEPGLVFIAAQYGACYHSSIPCNAVHNLFVLPPLLTSAGRVSTRPLPVTYVMFVDDACGHARSVRNMGFTWP